LGGDVRHSWGENDFGYYAMEKTKRAQHAAAQVPYPKHSNSDTTQQQRHNNATKVLSPLPSSSQDQLFFAGIIGQLLSGKKYKP